MEDVGEVRREEERQVGTQLQAIYERHLLMHH